LDGLTEKQRTRLLETLGAWLRTRGSAAEIAEQLNVHPQTVRYRMRQLEKTFGAQLDDPDERFALELVLRASRLRELAQRHESAAKLAEIAAHPAAS
jgi:DNA-binding PucR family transcriptional regulator